MSAIRHAVLILALAAAAHAQSLPPVDDFWLFPPAPLADAEFGAATALDGNTALVAAPGDDEHVYVFGYDPTRHRWEPRATLGAHAVDRGDDFGAAVALEGDVAVVGAPGSGAQDTGLAYVFERVGGAWVGSAVLAPPTATPDGHFGFSVALDGDRLAVGARGQGAVATFVRMGGTWVLEQDIPYFPGSWFGDALGLEGGTMLVGAPRTNVDRGSVLVYQLQGGTWVTVQSLVASTGSNNDFFGTAVGLDGKTLVVGACGVDDVLGNVGTAWVFERSGGVWFELQELPIPDRKKWDHFGRTVAIDEGTILVAGPPANSQGVRNVGRVCLFREAVGTWGYDMDLAPVNPRRDDYMGRGLSLQGDIAVVGLSLRDLDAPEQGAAIVFRF